MSRGNNMTIDTKALLPVTHDEARKILSRFANLRFRNHNIPIDPECDVVLRLGPYIDQCEESADRLAKLEAETQVLKEILDCRAGRLLVRSEPFFVVKASEPYARQVVELIKQHEGERWTEEDEQWAEQALASGSDK